MIDENLYKKTDGVLFNYKTIKAEINNLDLEIQEVESEYRGCGAITYEEKTGPTNKFNSSVENEIFSKRKMMDKLTREKESKQRLINKIDNAMSVLEETEREIIKLRCFEGYNWGKVGVLLNMDGDYCGRLKRAALNKIIPILWIGKKCAD